MKDRLLTVQDLIRFCKTNKMYNFSSKESGKPIVVQAIQDFSSAEIEESEDNKLFAKVRVCHTLLNRNGSYIEEDKMKEAMPSLKYAPLLANIHQLDDGSWDFHSHDYHIETDSDGNEIVVYDEKQVGTFTADDPYLEYDKEMDKTYVMARVAIPEEYTRCADILREKKESKVSCELIIYDCSYNAKEKYLQLDNFKFSGCTLLGCEKDGTPIGEGMLGSKITLEDFSEENNSIVKFNSKVIELQERLEKLESACFNKENSKEGGNEANMNKFEELLEKYGKTAEDITFDYEGLSDEELEAKFEEEFGEEDTSAEGSTSDDGDDPEDDAVKENEACGGKKKKKKCEKMEKTFEISHEDIRYALYNLLASYEEADNEWYYVVGVYDKYFVYESWDGGKIYGQNYTKDNDNVAFDGERFNLHAEYLTDSEYAELQSLRSNYEVAMNKLNEYEATKLHAEREAALNDEQFSIITEIDAFKTLYENMDNYSVADLVKEAKVILADNYSATFASTKKAPTKIGVSLKPETNKPYGNLFSDNK